MEEYIDFHKVLDKLQYFQENNPRLNSFGYGNLVDFGKNVSGTTVVYPFLFIVPLSIQYDENTTTYQVSAIFADRLNEDLTNEKDCVSDMSLCARDLLSQIKRGDLFDYFETILPAQAQPFMERFNDNVAGVALDLNIQVFEDINACVQYPTPTPSNTPGLPTPSVTPTQTVTPTVTQTPGLSPSPTPSVTQTLTPSVTPSVTPTMTPSSTPPPLNPLTLGALWWSVYSDPSKLNLAGTNITSVIDQVDGTTLFKGGVTGSLPLDYQGGVFTNVCSPSFSGGTRFTSGEEKITTLNGDYSGSTDFTFFTRYYYTGTTGESVLCSADSGGGELNSELYDGSTTLYRWYQNKMDGTNIQFNKWADPNTGNGFFNLNVPITGNTWINQCWRTYQDGSQHKMEVYVNGNLIASGSTNDIGAAPVGGPGQIQGSNFFGSIAEQFWFNKKLSTSEINDMFSYLNSRYC